MPATAPTAAQVRQQFIDFFTEKCGHAFVPSSPVVPHDDPTLLFANAGMNQFKPYFLGTEDPPTPPRAANTQKCIRAGGKHNDLDDVGKDTYHHTFFEMLGNWSFGDYFKTEAIDWAWTLLTDVWGIDPNRLHATYFEGDPSEGLEPDDEAKQLWLAKLPPERVHPGNKKDNFWEMGDTGPCGPCSEIHYDGTPDFSGGSKVNADDPNVIEIWNLVFIQFNRNADGKLASLPAKHVDTGMGFERIVRVLQGKDSNYDTDVFTPIFEAIQKVTGARAYEGDMLSEIDVAYRVIADHIRTLTFALTDGAHCGNEGRNYVLRRILRRAVRYGRQQLGVSEPFFYKLVPTVVEHFGDVFPELKTNPDAVADELREEEESFSRTLDRGIELFQSAIMFAFINAFNREQLALKNAGKNEGLHSADILGGARMSSLEQMAEEERRFVDEGTLPINDRTRINIRRVDDPTDVVAAFHPDELSEALFSKWLDTPPVLPGSDAFTLYDTYGFPLDLTKLMAEERGMTVDETGFDARMAEHQEQSRAGGGGADAKASLVEFVQKGELPATEFVGYDQVVAEDSDALEVLVKQGDHYEVAHLIELGAEAAVIVEKTPFYAEAGGQVGDTGTIHSTNGAVFRVTDTVKVGDVYFHLGELETGNMRRGEPAFTDDEPLLLEIDAERRGKIKSHHTSTHLMNWALREVLGDHIQQRGSLVDDEKTRFDFSHNKALTAEEIERVEQLVNEKIDADLAVYAKVAPQEDAMKIHGLRAVFGEKYPPRVRVVSIGAPVKDLLKNPDNPDWRQYSVEFCGGTHLASTGEAQRFAVINEEGVAKGVRRITAVAGESARRAEQHASVLTDRLEAMGAEHADSLEQDLAAINESMNEILLPSLARTRLRDRVAELGKIVKDAKKAADKEAEGDVVATARTIAEAIPGDVVVAQVPGANADSLRKAMDVIRAKKPAAAMMLAAVVDDKIAFLAAVSDEKIKAGLKAGDWVREVAKVAGGGGGGRPDMAQAGGKNPAKLEEALEVAKTFAAEKLN